MKKGITFLFFIFCVLVANAQSIAGSWYGLLDVQGSKLRLVLNVKQEITGDYSMTMDSPDQGARGIPVNSVKYENGNLAIQVSSIGMSYSAEVRNDSIVGIFSQGLFQTSLTFVKQGVKRNRPQEPQAPFRYKSEDITFHNKAANLTLAGTLTYPSIGTNFPVVILITGSGAQNRDEEIMGHKPFWVIADYLTNQGIAVLRFDDRGVGKSGGDFTKATTEDFSADVLAAVNYLKGRKEFNPNNIGLIGHSEGGTIAFMLAGRNQAKIAFIVSMAGTALDGVSVLERQRELLSLAYGASKEQIAEQEELIAKMLTVIESQPCEQIARDAQNIAKSILPENLKLNEYAINQMVMELEKLSSPWMKYFLQYDPAVDIAKITCPVLAINGAKDLQVDAKHNIGKIKSVLANNKNLETIIYPSLNHLFQHCQTGLPAEYGEIEETIADEVLKDMSDWIKKVSKAD